MPSFHSLPRAGRLVAVLLTAVALGCSGARGTAQTSPTPAPSSYARLSPVEKARADSARYPYTSADVQFMSGMIHHHAQAVAMSRWAPTHGAGSSLRILAERITNAQQDEIVLMQQWLRDRRQTVPEASATGMKMRMNGMEHEMLMPGMLTADQMRQLDQARGTEFDRLFLTFMIQHHRGAVSMVKGLFDTQGAAQDEAVFKFATDVNVDQTTEVARMERMLTALVQQTVAP
jgi:uncharacterized protein (DUF305 family)